MHETLHLQLVTPARTIFEQEVKSVIIPTEAGQITVLPDHAPIVSVLETGELIVNDGEKEYPLAVYGGTLEMFDNRLVILADSAEQPDEIDVAAAQQRAKDLAAELEDQEKMDITTYNNLMQQLRAEQARLAVGSKWRG